ncbi:hypothetical protein SDC9_140710 [bioreactor metagenome]|uniref:Uncharacterized protein n=1 Tax=bioreactor metagenome TaxID=1076179 RepID=A0A645DW66_9ZZZZ
MRLGLRPVEGDPAVFPYRRTRLVVVHLGRQVVEYVPGMDRNFFLPQPENPFPPDAPEQLHERFFSGRNELLHPFMHLEVSDRARIERQHQIRQ